MGIDGDRYVLYNRDARKKIRDPPSDQIPTIEVFSTRLHTNEMIGKMQRASDALRQVEQAFMQAKQTSHSWTYDSKRPS
jgi:hypothetical protein